MAKLIWRDLKLDDPIFREGSQTFVPPPRPRPAKPLTAPPMSDEEMAEQYSLQAAMERALRGRKER
jgi:hypothetical protein